MKKLSLINLEKRYGKEEKLSLKKLMETKGGLKPSGCCHGYCQSCTDGADALSISRDENTANSTY